MIIICKLEYDTYSLKASNTEKKKSSMKHTNLTETLHVMMHKNWLGRDRHSGKRNYYDNIMIIVAIMVINIVLIPDFASSHEFRGSFQSSSDPHLCYLCKLVFLFSFLKIWSQAFAMVFISTCTKCMHSTLFHVYFYFFFIFMCLLIFFLYGLLFIY